MAEGSLIIVGTGIQLGSDLTLGAQAWIRQAEKVFFAVADPLTALWLPSLNPTAEPLPYSMTSRRKDTYARMAEVITAEVRRGKRVCAVFYGHPGVFADPAHEAMKRVQQEGFTVKMLPGVSADACLYADLGIDPGRQGCQSFDATDFLIRRRRFDPYSTLLLWQLKVLGNLGFSSEEVNRRALEVLSEVLQAYYPPDHQVVLYEAACYVAFKPHILSLALEALPDVTITDLATLYVPPLPAVSPDPEMMRRLGMTSSLIGKEPSS